MTDNLGNKDNSAEIAAPSADAAAAANPAGAVAAIEPADAAPSVEPTTGTASSLATAGNTAEPAPEPNASEEASEPEPNGQPEPQSSTRKRSARLKAVIGVVILALVIIAASIGYPALTGQNSSNSSAAAAIAEATASGQDMTDSQLTLADGTSTSLSEIANGKPLVVNFWATWCPYCIDEMGSFESLYNDYGNSISFAMVDLVDGSRETLERGTSFVEKNGWNFPVYYDIGQRAARDYGISSLPTTMVVTANGKIIVLAAGVIDEASMRELLDELAR